MLSNLRILGEILLLGIYPRELITFVHTKTYIQMFIAALFIIAKKDKQPLFLVHQTLNE